MRIDIQPVDNPSRAMPVLVTVPPLRCSECTRALRDRSEGWEDGKGGLLCQDCWEAHCDREWWKAVKDLEPTGVPDEYRRVTPAITRIGQDHGEGEG